MTRICAILALIVSMTPSSVVAQPREIVVKLTKDDLSSESRMRKRAAAAIEELCGSYASIEPYQWPDIDKCWQSAWRGVNRQITELRRRESIKLGAK